MARDLGTLEQQLRQQQATAAALILENERCEHAARHAVDEAQELRQTVQGLQNRLFDLQQDLSQVHKARRQEQQGVDSATQTEKNSSSEVEVVNLRDQLAGKNEVIRILKEGKARLTGDLASLERLARQAEHEVTRLRHKLHQSGFAHSPQSVTVSTPPSFLGSEGDAQERPVADSSLMASASRLQDFLPLDVSPVQLQLGRSESSDKRSGVVWAREKKAGDECQEEGGLFAEMRSLATQKAPANDDSDSDQDGERFYSPRGDDAHFHVPSTAMTTPARADSEGVAPEKCEIATGYRADARQRALDRSQSPQLKADLRQRALERSPSPQVCLGFRVKGLE